MHTFHQENTALQAELAGLGAAAAELDGMGDGDPPGDAFLAIREKMNALTDVEKHYLRKERLFFPFLEKHGITGPPKVMWGKHDETRALLRGALEAVAVAPASAAEARAVVALAVKPAAQAIHDMIGRRRTSCSMSLETLDELEWWEVARQSAESGSAWWTRARAGALRRSRPPGDQRGPGRPRPAAHREPHGEGVGGDAERPPLRRHVRGRKDRVRYFTHGNERVFARSRAVLGRKVQHCHPPSSVDTVDRILEGFRSGKQQRADFWIDVRGRFVHIEYVALRDAGGAYLGCLEVTQDLTAKRALTGEQRLLSWSEEAAHA